VTCLIAVEKQDGFTEVLFEKIYSPARERASHASNDARYPGLMYIEGVKETLPNDYTLAMVNGPAKVEKDERLAEGDWKPIFWLSQTYCRAFRSRFNSAPDRGCQENRFPPKDTPCR